jgi:hypothetical protein
MSGRFGHLASDLRPDQVGDGPGSDTCPECAGENRDFAIWDLGVVPERAPLAR